MADESNTFDAELNAIMEHDAAPAAPVTPAQPTTNANPAPEKVWEAGGRKWQNPDDLAKAHDSLVREFGSRNKDWQELGELRKVKEQFTKDPQLAAYFKSSMEAYQRAREAGQSKATASKNSDLPREVIEKIERHDRLADQIELEREETALARKFNIDHAMVQKVGDYSIANGGIPLEHAYKQMMWDLNQQKIADQKKRETEQKKEVSRTSGPTPSHLAPSNKGLSLKNDASWREAAGKELSKFYPSE